MAKYRKKPVVIDAWRWEPGDLVQAGLVIGELLAAGVDSNHPDGMGGTTTLAIHTLEGVMTAEPGDWILKGIKGEFYPCKNEIFEATYQPVQG
jgi:hypothetical protein